MKIVKIMLQANFNYTFQSTGYNFHKIVSKEKKYVNDIVST